MMGDTGGQVASPPTIAAYNIRYLSLSHNQKEQWNAKLDNAKWLAKENDMVALFETHAKAAKADMFFCSHIPGVNAHYDDGIAVLVIVVIVLLVCCFVGTTQRRKTLKSGSYESLQAADTQSDHVQAPASTSKSSDTANTASP